MADERHEPPTQASIPGDSDATAPITRAAAGKPAAGEPAAGEPAAGEPAAGKEEPRWAARAAVPPAPAPHMRSSVASGDWTEVVEDPHGGRAWLAPVFIAITVLVLLAVLAAALWLILGDPDRDTKPLPAVSASATASASPSPSPSSASASPSSVASSPAPEPVVVPLVVGLSLAAARRVLEASGLTHTVLPRAEAGVPAGTVVEVSPAAGSLVAPGTEIVLVVAVRPTPSASGRSSASAPVN